MAEQPEWRLETYQDEMDPFSAIQYYVMHGKVLIAQCEILAHADMIIAQNQRVLRYERALEQIAAMSAAAHDVDAAVASAQQALRDAG